MISNVTRNWRKLRISLSVKFTDEEMHWWSPLILPPFPNKNKNKNTNFAIFFNLLVFFLYFFLFPIFLPNQIQMYTRLKDLWWFCGIREPSSNGSFLKNILYNSSQIKLRNKFIFSSSGNKKISMYSCSFREW